MSPLQHRGEPHSSGHGWGAQEGGLWWRQQNDLSWFPNPKVGATGTVGPTESLGDPEHILPQAPWVLRTAPKRKPDTEKAVGWMCGWGGVDGWMDRRVMDP